LYVDDLLVTEFSLALINKFNQGKKNVFEMTDLGLMTYFLGMDIIQNKNEIFICQQKYAKEIPKKFQLDECKIMKYPINHIHHIPLITH